MSSATAWRFFCYNRRIRFLAKYTLNNVLTFSDNQAIQKCWLQFVFHLVAKQLIHIASLKLKLFCVGLIFDLITIRNVFQCQEKMNLPVLFLIFSHRELRNRIWGFVYRSSLHQGKQSIFSECFNENCLIIPLFKPAMADCNYTM